MRAVSAIALLALLLVGSCSASIAARSEPVRAPSPTSPWKIVEDWNVTLPAGGMQIFPTYTSVPGLYVATTSTGIVCGINTTTRSIQWQQQYPDIAFVSALESTGAIFVARYSGTTVLDSVTGNQIWFAANVTMSPNLAESYNALVFGKNIVYRDETLGYTRLCAVDGVNGNQLWCDNRRTLGSPDAALNGTFTAQLFDVNSSAYVANIDATTGKENWFAFADRVLTGSTKYVAVIYQGKIVIVNSMTGLHSAYYDVSNIAPIHNAVFVKEDVFAFTDGHSWVAAVDCTTGKLMWNVTAPYGSAAWRIDMQNQGENILVVASLSSKHTNFTRLSALTGDVQWTVTAMPTGMSLAPVHAWLADAILYVRNTNNRWSAWGADSGLEVSSGSGDLFLPRSVMPAYTRAGYSFYVTTNGGQMIDLRVERK